MKRLHMHVVVESLADAVEFYSSLFDKPPCCGSPTHANWRIDEPPLNLAASVTDRPPGVTHFGLEVERPSQLQAIDRALHNAMTTAGTIPWEISVRPQPKELDR
jgi:hypothetical protein